MDRNDKKNNFKNVQNKRRNGNGGAGSILPVILCVISIILILVTSLILYGGLKELNTKVKNTNKTLEEVQTNVDQILEYVEPTPIPEVTPEETPEVTPEETPEVTPETTPGETQAVPEGDSTVSDGTAATDANSDTLDEENTHVESSEELDDAADGNEEAGA